MTSKLRQAYDALRLALEQERDRYAALERAGEELHGLSTAIQAMLDRLNRQDDELARQPDAPGRE